MISIVIGGRGAVGGLFCEMLADAGPTMSVDLTEAHDHRTVPAVVADVLAPDARLAGLIGHADLVLLALPEHAMTAAMSAVAPLMSAGALLAHTSSVQSVIAAELAGHARERGIEACGVDPMFAPALGFRGRAVVLTEVEVGAHVDTFEQCMAGAGARVVRTTPAEHDRLTANLQVAVHASLLAFGLSISGSGTDIDRYLDLATPPARALLTLLARLCTGNPHVYQEIQHEHPSADVTRVRLGENLQRLSADDFAATMGEITVWLGDRRAQLADDCARWFADATQSSTTST